MDKFCPVTAWKKGHFGRFCRYSVMGMAYGLYLGLIFDRHARCLPSTMMTALIILGGLSMMSTVFILAALVAAKQAPSHNAVEMYTPSTETHEATGSVLVPSVRLAA